MVEKQIEEDRGHQYTIMNLAHEFDNACTAKDDLQKAYKKCNDIPLDQRALIDNILKIKSDKDYEMHNALFDVNPQPNYHKWEKFMSFKPDIPETPLYKSKLMISKHYNKETEVEVGNIFDNKKALDLAIRLKALDDGYQFLSDRSALERGSSSEAFEMLPYYCYNLERKNQGTVTRIKTDEKGVFEMLFIAIGASIRTFVNYLRPLLIIDATHLKGQYKGRNLLAVGMDGNNQIMPIGFGICKGETGPCWSWWMSVLKECIGDSPNLLFISARHAAIALAV
ncbi:transposase, MuDR, MULE transposase domain protein [Tanacetum coccineum]|uniref:Transposase, MuDR, MULE transposase domain protein n=1 Tax=Tanacetum coccineum TaxID=301880 RepID=A0ABQ5E5C3_9ASTR